jgi:hypothetical protein
LWFLAPTHCPIPFGMGKVLVDVGERRGRHTGTMMVVFQDALVYCDVGKVGG